MLFLGQNLKILHIEKNADNSIADTVAFHMLVNDRYPITEPYR